MATNVPTTGSQLIMELGGQPAGTLRSLQPPGYRLDRLDRIDGQRGGSVIRAGSAVTLGELAAEFSPDQPGLLRDWVQRFASGDLAPQSGAAQVLDFNFALRRSLAFEAGQITQLRLPALSASDGRSPVLLGLSWRVQALRDSPGDGRRITLSKGRAKALLASNFRVTGLPFDGSGITRVGLPLLRRIDTDIGPRRPPQQVGALGLGELMLTVGGRSRDKALAWVQQVVADGRLDEAERLDMVVELLDATQKTVLATLQLRACSLLACDETLIQPEADAVPGLALRFAVGSVALGFSKG